VRSLAALAVLILSVGCSPDEPRIVVHAADCWGHADCADGLSTARSALGVQVAAAADLQAVSGAACGPVVDCRSAAAVRPTPRPAVKPKSEASTPRGVADTTTPSTPTPSTPTPEVTTPAVSEPVAAASGAACEGVSARELEKSTSLTPADLLCLGDIAQGAVTASDSDRQIAAVALYNRKASGWQKAVEAALKRPSLRNAPALNFAGIKTAYDRGRYGAVVARADIVWRNLDKGYQLSDSDKTFLSEFACRSSGQLALQGNPPGSGLDWCERWMARASKAGADTGPIQDLIDQLE
jgi:hypothetical protein